MDNKDQKTIMTKKHYIAIYISLCIALMGYIPNLNISFTLYVILEVINLIILVFYLVYLDNKQVKEYNKKILNQGDG